MVVLLSFFSCGDREGAVEQRFRVELFDAKRVFPSKLFTIRLQLQKILLALALRKNPRKRTKRNARKKSQKQPKKTQGLF
jgi:hypothetical protein